MVWTTRPVENTVPQKTAPKTLPDSTPALDAHCKQLLRRLAAIGGFRPGSMVPACRRNFAGACSAAKYRKSASRFPRHA